MSFSLTNAPTVFQAFVNDVLRDMLNKLIFVSLDDIFFPSQPGRICSACEAGVTEAAGEYTFC